MLSIKLRFLSVQLKANVVRGNWKPLTSSAGRRQHRQTYSFPPPSSCVSCVPPRQRLCWCGRSAVAVAVAASGSCTSGIGHAHQEAAPLGQWRLFIDWHSVHVTCTACSCCRSCSFTVTGAVGCQRKLNLKRVVAMETLSLTFLVAQQTT